MDEIEITDKSGKKKYLISGDEMYEYKDGKKIRREDLEVHRSDKINLEEK